MSKPIHAYESEMKRIDLCRKAKCDERLTWRTDEVTCPACLTKLKELNDSWNRSEK